LGTLAELALVWNMMLANETRQRPLMVVGPEWPQVIDSIRAYSQMGSSALKLLTFVDAPEAVLAAMGPSVSSNNL
jgi:predicted Rossmann-fold nucleotide-binding protein